MILLDTYLYFLLLKHTLMTWLPESFWSLYGVLGVFKVKFEFRDAQGKAKGMFNLQALSFCYPNSLVQFTLIRKELSTYGIWRSMTFVVSRFFLSVPAMFRKTPLHTVTDAVTHFFHRSTNPLSKFRYRSLYQTLLRQLRRWKLLVR